MKIIWLLTTFLGGSLLSLGCYFLAKWVILNHSGQFASVSIVRQVISVAYLTALFFLGRNSEYLSWLLIGGAFGVTVPSLLFTKKLIKVAQGQSGKEEDHG